MSEQRVSPGKTPSRVSDGVSAGDGKREETPSASRVTAALAGGPRDEPVERTRPLAAREGAGSAHNLLTAGGVPVVDRELTTEQLVQRAWRRNRRWLYVLLAATVLLLGAGFYATSPLTEPVAHGTPRAIPPVPLAEVQPYGVNTFLHKEVDRWKKEKTLSLAREMGAGWIKQQFPWAEIEFREDPNRPFWDVKNDQNAWDKFDGIVELAAQNGLRVIARIDSAPRWARNNDPVFTSRLVSEGIDPAKQPPLDEHLGEFQEFVETFVRRYKGRVAAIQVWNEPNLRAEWATGRQVNPEEYVELLKTAHTAAKEIDPGMIVLAAPLATNNERLEYAGNLNEVDYLQGMYEAGAAAYFDAMAANAYGTSFAPEDPPSRETLNFRRVELLREVMEKNGDGEKAVWFNEYGWNASPADMPKEKLRWGRVSEAEQAEYTVRGIEYARQNWPWAGVFTIWYLRQVGDIARSESEYFFALVNSDFVPSQAYRALKGAATEEEAATPGEWGPLSPPVDAGPRWQIRLNETVPGGVYVVPTGPGDTLEIPFVGTGLKVRLVPPAATEALSGTQSLAARYYVTIDGETGLVARELPRDESGRPYIDLTQATEVILVRGLGEQMMTGKHLAQIRVEGATGDDRTEPGVGMSGGGRAYSLAQEPLDLPGIATVIVEANRSYTFFVVLTLALLAAIGATIIALRRMSQPV